MAYGIQAACKIAAGFVGVVALSTSANTVSILAETVRRAASKLYTAGHDWYTGTTAEKAIKESTTGVWAYVKLTTPYSSTKDWTTLATAGALNIAVGTVALYVFNRYCPSLVTSANCLLHSVVGIQFTPDHIPLTKLAGL